MTPDELNLASRLVALEEWEWRPGMLHCLGVNPKDYGRVPNLHDPGTAGILLAMLREAAGYGQDVIAAWYSRSEAWCVIVEVGREGDFVSGTDTRLGVAVARVLLEVGR